MICHKCGSSDMVEQRADLPFRLDLHKILVVKDTPAHICRSCGEIALANDVMGRIERAMEKARELDAELEVVRYAA